MRLSRLKNTQRHKKKKRKDLWASIGLFALLSAMAFYSWDVQKSWKIREEMTRYLSDETK
eukprot:CAMPEP_0113655934 /NCGR_PEP_ID=MMETSP0017_2-20120614/30018_1 /TAXON_ID=2856 /ORGANISM="Cylindrotheca closterium" /LENGTH=59 /DNA_ID=CAMNT_0000569309 /DNA_START=49 /DNA_END=225 /DNA_ORIENTATION=+ /assembly_acc=CAM_ASM_000147